MTAETPATAATPATPGSRSGRAALTRLTGPAALAALTTLMIAACAPAVEVTSSAGACAAPSLHASTERAAPGDPVSLAAGDTVTIEAAGFRNGCADAIRVDEHGNQHAEPSSPMGPQTLTLHAGEETWVLGEATPDEHGSFRLEVTVPADVPAGDASITPTAAVAEHLPVRITAPAA